MIDTLRLKSPPLAPATIAALEAVSIHRIAFDAVLDKELWHITTAELKGSFDHRVRFRLESDGSITLEGSIHKLLLGHNVFGGSSDLVACSRFLVSGIEDLLGCSLPVADVWSIHKVDWAEVYYLGSFEAVEGYFRALQGVSYPRRKVGRHGFQSIHVPGRMTTLKLYHKGVEFRVHDRKRLRSLLQSDVLEDLQQYADKILRSEVSVTRRLIEDFGSWPLVSQITASYLRGVHDAEMSRLVREGEAQMQTVRTYMEVKARLYSEYRERVARVLLGTWMQLSALGEEETKKGMSRPTFFRHRKQLLDSGCSWHASDINQTSQIFPVDFLPVSSDSRCIPNEHDQVKKLLNPFRVA